MAKASVMRYIRRQIDVYDSLLLEEKSKGRDNERYYHRLTGCKDALELLYSEIKWNWVVGLDN
mgnify:CR=1 FL=1